MRILAVLSAIGKVETLVGDFYLWLSDVFEDDPEAAGFFYRLSMQERSHANLVAYAKKLVYRCPSDFKDVDTGIEVVTDLEEVLTNFRAEKPNPSLSDALRISMEVESHHAEKLHRSAVIESNPKVAELVNSLAVADEEHFQLLKTFVESRAGEM